MLLKELGGNGEKKGKRDNLGFLSSGASASHISLDAPWLD